MPSDLQRVAQGLVACLDQIPHLVELLHRTAQDLRQQAAYIGQGAQDRPGARIAALQLDHAARACEEAAHYASQAPPKAHAWAMAMVGGTSPHNLPTPSGVRPSGGTVDPGDTGRTSERSDEDADRTTISPKISKAASDKSQERFGGDAETVTKPIGVGDGSKPPSDEVIELSTSDPAHKKQLNEPPPSRTIRVDERFTYQTDSQGRVAKAWATLDAIDFDHPRSNYAQRTLKGKLPGDHAGHLFARIFLGPAQKINLTPMEGERVNKRYVATLEREWQQHIERGGSVNVTVELAFPNKGPRASHIRISYEIDGKVHRRTILNAPQPGEEPDRDV